MEDFKNSEFYKNLSEDIKAKLENCRSEEEAMDILKDRLIEVPDDILDKAAGGAWWPCSGRFDCF